MRRSGVMQVPIAAVGLLIVLACQPAWAQFGPDKPYAVPSDRGATYTNLSIEGQGRYRKIATQRSGKSGVSYSLREYDCDQERVRYLATGDARDVLQQVKPQAWAPIVQGSIASYIGGQACHGYHRKLRATK